MLLSKSSDSTHRGNPKLKLMAAAGVADVLTSRLSKKHGTMVMAVMCHSQSRSLLHLSSFVLSTEAHSPLQAALQIRSNCPMSSATYASPLSQQEEAFQP